MRLRIGFIGLMIALIGLTGSFRAFKPVQAAPAQPASTSNQANAPQGAARIKEQESNNTPATANQIIGQSGIVRGYITANDSDFFAIPLSSGQRLAAGTMTSASVGTADSILTLYHPDGTTVVEFDNDDGGFGSTASVISSAIITNTGTYYLKFTANNTTNKIYYYDLYLRVLTASPTPEQEPNNPAQLLPASGIVSGVVSTTADLDIFQVSVNAGDTIFATLDMDPERDGISWNGRLGIGNFNGAPLIVNDTNAVSPNAEFFPMTVKEAGNYIIRVDSTVAVNNGSYILQVQIIPAEAQINCQTYMSTDINKTIPGGPGMITSTLTIPNTGLIEDLDVIVQLDHTFIPDLDTLLTAPDGNSIALFTDVGVSTVAPATMNVVIDDEAAIPLLSGITVSGTVSLPELYRLSWFDGQRSQGNWTLTLYDDASGDGGTLKNWGLRVCAAPPPVDCPDGSTVTTIYSSDFESSNGGFTHAGTNDSWQYGQPNFAPIVGSYSGLNSWKTNLTGPYSASMSANLTSPAIDLSGVVGPIQVQWQQRYQLDTAVNDNYSVSVLGNTTQTLFDHRDGIMRETVGNPVVTIQQSTGWSRQLHTINDFVGQSINLQFHLDSDAAIQLAGVAIDNVQVTGCLLNPTATNTPTATATNTPTATATATNTPTTTNTPIVSDTPTNTPTATATATNTPTITVTPTNTNTPTITATPSNTPTNTNTPTITITPSHTPTATPSVTPGPTLIPVYLPWVGKDA